MSCCLIMYFLYIIKVWLLLLHVIAFCEGMFAFVRFTQVSWLCKTSTNRAKYQKSLFWMYLAFVAFVSILYSICVDTLGVSGILTYCPDWVPSILLVLLRYCLIVYCSIVSSSCFTLDNILIFALWRLIFGTTLKPSTLWPDKIHPYLPSISAIVHHLSIDLPYFIVFVNCDTEIHDNVR